MNDNKGMRSPLQRLADFWGRLDMKSRYGLSVVAALALLFIIFNVADWVAL